MASYLSKTQMNNYLNHTPPKSSYTPSTADATRDFSIKPSSNFSPSGYKYSPEMDGFRREVNDQIRNLFYSLTSEMKALKKENSEYKFQLDDIRREVETTNSKLVQFKSSHNAEINTLRNNLISGGDGEHFKAEETMKNNWVKKAGGSDYSGDINEINDKISQISRQMQTLTAEFDGFKKGAYITRETFSKSLTDIVDELERKLGIINDRVRERIEEMDASLTEALKDKDQDCQKLYYDIRNIQSSMIRVSDQVNTYTHSSEINLEDQVRKIMNNYSADIKNISSIANNTEQKIKMLRKDDIVVSPLMSSSLTQTHNEEFKTKLRELDSIYQTVTLLEKELRAKTDMVDLNINSIKRNLELELSIQIKHMILPIQKNIDQYLQTTEGRFSALEDAVLNHMKRDSYVMTADRANRFRSSHNEEYLQASGFNNAPSNIEFYAEERHERNRSSGDFKSLTNPSSTNPLSNNSGPTLTLGGKDFKEKLREKERERIVSQPFKIDEVDSVLSMGDVYQKQQDEKLLPEDLRDNNTAEVVRTTEIQETEEFDEVEEEQEVLTTVAKKAFVDKDKNKPQKSADKLFPNTLEPSSQPESLFRDFPSTQGMKTNLEMEHPDNKKPAERLSAKKKKPEIDVSENVKTNPKDTVKKLSIKDSPINLDSKLILGTESFNGDDITPPANFRAGREDKKKPEERRKETSISKESEQPPEEEFAGNIKGLLRKSRNNKRENTPSLEEVDRVPSPQRGKSTDSKKGYGNDPVGNQFQKNPPIQNKGLQKSTPLGPIGGGAAGANNLSNSKLKQELPPVDTKSVKNFNKGGRKDLPAPRQPAGHGFNQQQVRNQANNYYGGYDNNGWGQQGGEEDDGESVEEIVYHVDEEGFLVDEQGNYLVDEQGNFLQLSPDQMKEIEEKDLVYEKEF